MGFWLLVEESLVCSEVPASSLNCSFYSIPLRELRLLPMSASMLVNCIWQAYFILSR